MLKKTRMAIDGKHILLLWKHQAPVVKHRFHEKYIIRLCLSMNGL